MSVIEKLDSVLAKWRAREKRAGERAMNSEQDYGNQSWCGGVSEAAGDCADELDTLMPAIRQAMIDARRWREARKELLWAPSYDGCVRWSIELKMPEPDMSNPGASLDATIDARLASDSEGGE